MVNPQHIWWVISGSQGIQQVVLLEGQSSLKFGGVPKGLQLPDRNHPRTTVGRNQWSTRTLFQIPKTCLHRQELRNRDSSTSCKHIEFSEESQQQHPHLHEESTEPNSAILHGRRRHGWNGCANVSAGRRLSIGFL